MEAMQTAITPSFETVWASLQETDRMVKELGKKQEETSLQMKETDRLIKETAWEVKETGRQIKETDRQMKEYNKRFGDFTNRFGEVVEYMIAPNLQDKFYDMGMDFQDVCSNYKVRSKKSNISFQVDVFLQNGDTAMLVEIKTKLAISDINGHVERLEKMRRYADSRGDKRSFLGAVAGVVVESDEREYALSNGFFLIEPSGETFNITPPKGKPREW